MTPRTSTLERPAILPPTWKTAIHEAGHAVVALAWGLHFHQVDLHRRDDGTTGLIDIAEPDAEVFRGKGRTCLPWLIHAVAGHWAEERSGGCDGGCGVDYTDAWALAEAAADDAEVTAEALMAEANADAARLVAEDWRIILRVARYLYRHRELNRRQVEYLVYGK